MKIEKLLTANQNQLTSINFLISQLSEGLRPLTIQSLHAILSNENTTLLIASEDHHILGMLTVVKSVAPAGIKAWIEDVVVDPEARGRGIAKQLMAQAAVEATNFAAESINLTSRPEREVANMLYKKMGYEPRATNVYRLSLIE